MKQLRYPFTEEKVRVLKAGDNVSISGLIFTGRDKFHKFYCENPGKVEVDLTDGALYHCGPVVVEDKSGYRVLAAGPTTSVRENPYEPQVIANSRVRLIIGKGGMDGATLAAMKKHGAVYIQAVGGAAAISAAAVKKVAGVSHLEEFGAAEAVWHFEVENLAGVVAMDSHGVSLFDEVGESSRRKLESMG